MILSDYSFKTIFFTISNSNTDCGIKMGYAKRLITHVEYTRQSKRQKRTVA